MLPRVALESGQTSVGGRHEVALMALADGLLVASHLDKPANLRELVRDAVTAVLDAR